MQIVGFLLRWLIYLIQNLGHYASFVGFGNFSVLQGNVHLGMIAKMLTRFLGLLTISYFRMAFFQLSLPIFWKFPIFPIKTASDFN